MKKLFQKIEVYSFKNDYINMKDKSGIKIRRHYLIMKF